MTGPELKALAERLKANPYYLAYAFATGARSIDEAFQRDGGNHLFTAWNDERWVEQADADVVPRHYVSIAPGAMDRHIDLCARFIPEGVTDAQGHIRAPALDHAQAPGTVSRPD